MNLNMLVRGSNALRTVQDYIKLPGYYAEVHTEPTRVVREYRKEKIFWYDVLGYRKPAQPLRAGDEIVLTKFRLSAWAPRVPGLYWKVESLKIRQAARYEILENNPDFTLYTPVGKTMQILGGVGNVRLLPTERSRLLCASSSWEYWRGVPVLMEEDAFRAYRDAPEGIIVDARGVWRPMPDEYARRLGSDAGVPRYCVSIDTPTQISVRSEGRSWGWRCQSSAWTLFEYLGADNLPHYDFAYCTFRAFPPKSEPLEQAVSFVRDYVKKRNGRVLTDFDQEIPHFDAGLPLNDLMSQEVNPRRLRNFVDSVKSRALSPEIVRYDKVPQFLMQHFNIEELRILAMDYLDLDLEHLIGLTAGLAEQVKALVEFCEGQNRLEELVAGIVQQRPEVSGELAAIT